MSTIVEEKWESPENWTEGAGNTGGSLIYLIYDDTFMIDRDDALEALWANTEPQLRRADFIVERKSCSVTPINERTWIGTVKYGGYSHHETGESSFSFETIGGTQHIVSSLETIQTYGSLGKDFHKLINVEMDDNGIISSVNGLDKTEPIFSFSETYWKDDHDIDEAYKMVIYNLTGKTNNKAYKGFAIGELLFMGASGSKRRKYGDWELRYDFAAIKNVTNLTVGEITGVDKKGWEYLWVVTKKNNETGEPAILQVNIERIYDSGDFDDLEI